MENRASSASTRRSHDSASWKPAPTAAPRTAATLTMSLRRSQVNPSCQPAIDSAISPSGMSRRLSSDASPSTPSAESIRRSRPDENVSPLPRTTTTRTAGSSDAPIARSAIQVDGVWAFLVAGRSSVIVATRPFSSSRTPPRSRTSGSRVSVMPRA